MSFSATADRVVWLPYLSHDRKWLHSTKYTHSRAHHPSLEGNLICRLLCPFLRHSVELELLPIEVVHCANRDFRAYFAPVTSIFTWWLSYMNLTRIPSIYTRRPKMKWTSYVNAFESYRITYWQMHDIWYTAYGNFTNLTTSVQLSTKTVWVDFEVTTSKVKGQCHSETKYGQISTGSHFLTYPRNAGTYFNETHHSYTAPGLHDPEDIFKVTGSRSHNIFRKYTSPVEA